MSALSALAGAPRIYTAPNGAAIHVTGLSAEMIAATVSLDPSVEAALNGAGISFADIKSFGPTVIASIIASGIGKHGDLEAMEDAARLPLAIQLDLIEAIVAETFGADEKGFQGRLTRIAAAGGAQVEVTESPAA